MKWNPHPYQRKAIDFIIGNATAGLFLDPGLGKTSIVLASFNLLKRKQIAQRMLVVAPLRPAFSVWPKEIAKWDNFQHLTSHVFHADGGGKDLDAALATDVTIVNPEGLGPLSAALARAGHKRSPWQILVVDESTRFKHTTTQRFKMLKPLLPTFDRRVILTGSPAPNGLEDLFGQVFILDLGNALGRFITHYRVNYFEQTGFGGYEWRPRPGAAEAIYTKLKPLVLRMDGRDLLDMPPLIGVDPPLRVEVELPPAARKAYDTMEKTLIAEVEKDLIVAANGAAATMKCRQIAGGGIYTDPKATEWEHLHEAKVDAVAEIIEELQGKPALVAYEFKHDLDRLLKRFGKGTPWIGGGVPAKRFREIEAAWNDGAIPILLAQPQSVAHGLNLQGTGAAVIWHSLTWDLEVYEQFIRRVWRQGQKEKVIVHHIIAKDTVDEVILKGVGKKDRTQQALLGALKEYAAGRKRRAA